VAATAAVKTKAATILAGRMVTPPEQARHGMDLGHQLGLGWSRADDGQASQPARNDLTTVAIVDRNERAEETRGFLQRVVERQLTRQQATSRLGGRW
jgi:hypothetical protein